MRLPLTSGVACAPLASHGPGRIEPDGSAYGSYLTLRRLKAGKSMSRKHPWVGLVTSIYITALLLFDGACAAVIGRPDATPTQVPHLSLIYGVNLSLYDTNDQVVNNPATQQLLR